LKATKFQTDFPRGLSCGGGKRKQQDGTGKILLLTRLKEEERGKHGQTSVATFEPKRKEEGRKKKEKADHKEETGRASLRKKEVGE